MEIGTEVCSTGERDWKKRKLEKAEEGVCVGGGGMKGVWVITICMGSSGPPACCVGRD